MTRHGKNRALRLVSGAPDTPHRYAAPLCRREFTMDQWHGGTHDARYRTFFNALLNEKRRPLVEWVQLVPVVQGALNATYRERFKA